MGLANGFNQLIDSSVFHTVGVCTGRKRRQDDVFAALNRQHEHFCGDDGQGLLKGGLLNLGLLKLAKPLGQLDAIHSG
jgi:hypothetical protein